MSAWRSASLYLMATGGLLKIGISKHCMKRRKQIARVEPDPVHILMVVDTGCHVATKRTERELHERFADIRVRGEWFEWSEDIFRAYAELEDRPRHCVSLFMRGWDGVPDGATYTRWPAWWDVS